MNCFCAEPWLPAQGVHGFTVTTWVSVASALTSLGQSTNLRAFSNATFRASTATPGEQSLWLAHTWQGVDLPLESPLLVCLWQGPAPPAGFVSTHTMGKRPISEPIINAVAAGTCGGQGVLQQQTLLVCISGKGIIHRITCLQWTGPREKLAVVPFPAGVLQFHPPHTKPEARIWGDRPWESPTTEATQVSGGSSTTSISAAAMP